MSTQNQLFDPEFYVDGILVPIVPGSYKAPIAPGEIKTRVLMSGQGRTLVRGVDNESRIDKASVTLAVTDKAKKQIKEWKRRSMELDHFVVKAVFPKGDRADDILKFASLDNDPEAEYSADGNVDLEFTGISSGE